MGPVSPSSKVPNSYRVLIPARFLGPPRVLNPLRILGPSRVLGPLWVLSPSRILGPLRLLGPPRALGPHMVLGPHYVLGPGYRFSGMSLFISSFSSTSPAIGMPKLVHVWPQLDNEVSTWFPYLHRIECTCEFLLLIYHCSTK